VVSQAVLKESTAPTYTRLHSAYHIRVHHFVAFSISPFFRPVRSFNVLNSSRSRSEIINIAIMHSNILTLAIYVLAVPASVTARPNMYAISERAIESSARSAHPITLRRRNQRAQLQAVSCNVPAAAEAGQEAAVGAKEKDAVAGAQQKEAAAGAKEKEAAVGGKEKEVAGEEEAKESKFSIHSRQDT
jgi:hypothetical protein